jgi:hypothetical protein
MELARRLAIYPKSKGPASFHKDGTLVEFYDVLEANGNGKY